MIVHSDDKAEKFMMLLINIKTNRVLECIFCSNQVEYSKYHKIVSDMIIGRKTMLSKSVEDIGIFRVSVTIDNHIDLTKLENKLLE